MSGPFVVGVDCGTQSAKVLVVDGTGRVVGSGREPLQPMLRPRHGVALHPDDDLWRATCAASQAAMASFAASGGDPGAIAAVGLCPIRCNKAFLDAEGRLVEPMMSWMDARAYTPYRPDDERVRWATTASGYFAHRTTGRFCDTAANNIDVQWPIDTDTWRWSDDPAAYERHGVTPSMLVELQQPGDVIGPLIPRAAAELGLPAGITVVHTANDKAVEMLGSGSVGPGTVLVSLGTYIAAMVHGLHNHRSPRSFWTNFASVPGRYLYESNGIRRGMWTLTWLLDLIGPEFAERAAGLGVSRESLLEDEARRVPAGSDGLLTVLDWLAPDSHPFRKGAMLGFDARHGRGHLYRSVLEAIAMTMCINVEAMFEELGTIADEVVVSGGGAGSELVMTIFADVFGVPAARVRGGGGAAVGAAACAAAAVGLHPGIEAAARAMSGPRETFAPDPAAHATYRRIADELVRDIHTTTDPYFERAYPLFH